MKLFHIPVLVSLAALSLAAQAQAYRLETVAKGLEHPWSIAFLPEGRLLVTERAGRLRVIEPDGTLAEPVAGLPEIFVSGQAGLFEVLLAQDFERSQSVFISFAHGDADANHTRVIKAQFDGRELRNVTPVFTSLPSKYGDAHFGGRMLLLPDGTLLLGLGDGFYLREEAQKLDSHLATIVRINTDGSVPADNPFVGREHALPEIYSYGHRHVQGLVYDAQTSSVFAHEHGPRGGDELNRIVAGRNYGWPLVTFGRDYSRAMISPFTEGYDTEPPLHHWTPSIAPAGLALYDGSLFPQWTRSLFVAALAEKSVRRMTLDADGLPGDEEILFTEVGQRMRDVRGGPDGALYLVTDEPDGHVLRVVPASAR